MKTNHLFPKRYFVILSGLILAALLAILGYSFTRTQFIVYADNEVHLVSGDYDRVEEVLSAAGVEVRAEDIVSPAMSASVKPGDTIQIQRAVPVTLRTDNGTQTRWTLQTNLAAFLTESGVTVGRTDQVFVDGEKVDFGDIGETAVSSLVEVGHFVNVTILDNNNRIEMRTAAQTVGDALEEAGLNIFAADGVDPPPGSWLTPDLTITVQRSMPLTIHVDGQTIQTRSHHTNVLQVLAEAGIGLIGQDFTRPGPDVPLQAGNTIEVVRVTEDFRTEDQDILFETVFQGTDQLEIDQRAVLSEGVTGIMRTRIRVRYENGVEVSQIPDGQWVAREPVNRVVGYGTNIVLRSLDTPDGPVQYWRVVRMRVTAYTAASSGKPPDHPAYGITASGAQAGTGVVAIDPNVVPFESWVYVPGYGVGFAGDTGGGVKGRWIDLGYDDGEIQAWSGYVDVYYLAPAPPADKINYLLPTWLP
ncbi:MAG: ubiquitin-like domain-containing protein [Candidatus Promineifilaceae bacterium]